MTKLCPRGKAAAKRKFKVYPSAYANAYASKICAGKIKDPSGTKRKDWGPKKAKVGMAVTAGSQSAMGRLEKSGMAKAKKGKFLSVPRGKEKISPGTPGPYKFRRQLPNTPKTKRPRTEKEKIIYGPKENPGPKDNKKKRNILEIMDDVAETINAPFLRQYKNYSKGSPPKGVIKPGMKSPKKKVMPGDPDERRDYLRNIQNPKSEYDKKGKLKYTFANKGKIMQVANKLEKASKAHAGQAKTLKSLKLSRGGGAAIKGTNFKGVF